MIAVDQAFDNHDWQTLTRFTVDGLVNYFGHRYATNAYIARDMQGDAHNYAWAHSTPWTKPLRGMRRHALSIAASKRAAISIRLESLPA